MTTQAHGKGEGPGQGANPYQGTIMHTHPFTHYRQFRRWSLASHACLWTGKETFENIQGGKWNAQRKLQRHEESNLKPSTLEV